MSNRIERAIAGSDRQASSIDARLLKLQLRAGSLPRNGSYIFDEVQQEFRALSTSQVERDREEQDLRLHKFQVAALADLRRLKAELDRKYR